MRRIPGTLKPDTGNGAQEPVICNADDKPILGSQMVKDGWQILNVYQQYGDYNAFRLEAALHDLAWHLPKNRLLNRQIGGGGVSTETKHKTYGVYIVYRMGIGSCTLQK